MKREVAFAWRSLVVAAGYAGTLALTDALRGHSTDAHSLIWRFVGAASIGLALGPIAWSMGATWKRHMLLWGSIVFFNIASVTIEGRFFVPGHVQGSLFVLLLQQLAASLVATWLIARLFAPIAEAAPIPTMVRPWFSWLWRFAASALSYIVFYFFFGAINYLLVTGSYYKTRQGGLLTPPPGVILQAELVRAPLIVLSVVPFLVAYPGTRPRTALLTGLILFTVGGLAPLLMEINTLPLPLLGASAVEIFFQNFCTGMVAARLLGRPEPDSARRKASEPNRGGETKGAAQRITT